MKIAIGAKHAGFQLNDHHPLADQPTAAAMLVDVAALGESTGSRGPPRAMKAGG
jgi:hypothetical protein